MLHSRRVLLSLTLICLVLFLSLPPLLRPQPASAEGDPRCFSETGQCLGGRFLQYWQERGGLAIFGYPISGELWEDGRLVQYFERNRFELHSENAAPYDVLLGQLGTERLRADGRDWHAALTGAETPGCHYFKDTWHSLCGDFLTYWQNNGGLSQFGFPITEPTQEINEADGQAYTVQYFERNRFELHPENAAPYNVLVGLLGNWRAGWLLGDTRTPAEIRATISGPDGDQAPLAPVTLRISAGAYSGPAELRVFDGAGQAELVQPVTLSNGAGSVTLASGGALGSHPAVLLIDGKVAGIATAAYTLDAQTSITTGLKRYDVLYPRVKEMLSHDTLGFDVDGHYVYGYRSPDSALLWMRDHVYQGLGYRYFEHDMTSLLDFFRRNQHADGSFDDYIGQFSWGRTQGRMEVEADLEFLFVQGVFQAWQATGDDGWLRANAATMERAINYITSDPKRWEASLELVKRPFTIDTWDFEYGGPTTSPDGKTSPRHWIDGDTKWSIMHGDNTGLAYAMTLLARIADEQGDVARAAQWRGRASELMQRLNNTSWNGTFFTHQVHLSPVVVPGLDENKQLSLSNAYALNRDVLSDGQALSIINEYERRFNANSSNTFAEWYSIDPPFPAGSFGTDTGWGDQPGEYVNGGIMPLVGGELARGAFRYGKEQYAFNILQRYSFLLEQLDGSYLWYHPAGNPGISGPNSLDTDGWGSTAMLAALTEGAAGIVDRGALFHDVALSPRWAADPDVKTANVTVRYGASYGYVAYRWERLASGDGLRLVMTSSAQTGTLHLLLPQDATANVSITIGGTTTPVRETLVNSSRYVELPLPKNGQTVEVHWR